MRPARRLDVVGPALFIFDLQAANELRFDPGGLKAGSQGLSAAIPLDRVETIPTPEESQRAPTNLSLRSLRDRNLWVPIEGYRFAQPLATSSDLFGVDNMAIRNLKINKPIPVRIDSI
jgi:hypothetical protein